MIVDPKHQKAEDGLNQLRDSAIEEAQNSMKALHKEMGTEKFNKWVEFNNKWVSFKQEGRDEEARLLKEKYLKDNGE